MALVDFDALINQTTQTVFGNAAVLTPSGSAGPLELTAIFGNMPMADPNGVHVDTIKPVAAVRLAVLVAGGLSTADLPGARLDINGAAWRVESFVLDPTPNGEGDAEVTLILIEA